MTSTALQVGDVVAGKYRIERVVGEGAMGIVFAAWHTELEQEVALKLLTDDAMKNRNIVERFEREARSAVKIKSRHVARVSDVGKLESGAPYMVMEYLEGLDLEVVMAKDGPLAIVRAVDYVLQACDAIAEAHAYGIVHRDLKPANLFLADQGGGLIEIKVLDFGISKSTKPGEEAGPAKGLTHASEIFGSPMYMSPEQLTSTAKVDARADIWSLGIILYELVTGEPPFHEGSVAEIWSGILHKPIRRPREKRPSLPAALETAMMKALVRDADERYATIADFAEAIAPFGTGDAQPCVERAKRFRSRVAAAGTGIPEPVASSRTAALQAAIPATPASSGIEDSIDVDIDMGQSVRPPPAPAPISPTRAEPRPLPRPLAAAPARTTTDWQSAPPPARLKIPALLVVFGVIAAAGGTFYVLRLRTPDAPATQPAQVVTEAPATGEATAISVEPPPEPSETARAGTHHASYPRTPLGRGSPSASAAASSSAAPAAASAAPPAETEEPATEPVIQPPPQAPLPAPPPVDPLAGAHRKTN